MIVVCIICIDFVCMLNIKSIRLITLWSEVSYRDVSHQRHPLLSTCFHMFQNKLDERERGRHTGGIWAISKKCSIIQQNCEGCQHFPRMSLLSMVCLLADCGLKRDDCVKYEILCLINEMSLIFCLPVITAVGVGRLWVSSLVVSTSVQRDIKGKHWYFSTWPLFSSVFVSMWLVGMPYFNCSSIETKKAAV